MIVKIMQQTILFKVQGKPSTSPVVILSAPDLAGKSKTNHFRAATKMLSRALSEGWHRAKCICTPRNIVRAIFSSRMSAAVATVITAVMWWHIMTVDNAIEMQHTVAIDCLLGTPWGIVWAIRTTLMSMPKKGGEE